jgi:hypothetical protein
MWHGNALIMTIPSKASNMSLSVMSRDFNCSNNIGRKNLEAPESSALLITEERYIQDMYVIYIYIYRYIPLSVLYSTQRDAFTKINRVVHYPNLIRSSFLRGRNFHLSIYPCFHRASLSLSLLKTDWCTKNR